MSENNFDIKKIDAEYKAFPSFAKWQGLKVNESKWEKNIDRLASISDASPDVLEHAKRIVMRYAAIETGAIEKLYEVDRGFTWTVALETANFQSLLSGKGKETDSIIKSQLEGYDFILDIATGESVLTEAWIRQLHEVLCRSQENYLVVTPQGPQKAPLPLGRYKQHPNHVMVADGQYHSYAPVDMVGVEMNRMINEFSGDPFLNAHPVLQAAYSHYVFVCVHPFSDGNGRVDRALASIFLYRAHSIPFLVLAEDRIEYLNSLEEADNGNFERIIHFTRDSCFIAIDLIELSLKAGAKKPIKDVSDKLNSFYQTKGGYTHEEVDKAGQEFVEAALKSLQIFAKNMIKEQPYFSKFKAQLASANYDASISNDYRSYLDGRAAVIITSVSLKPPLNVHTELKLKLHIPKDCDSNDDFIIINPKNNEKIFARLNEILPKMKPSLSVKIDIFIESLVSELMANLLESAIQAQ